MESFQIALRAVVPFAFYLAMGYIAKHRGIVDDDILGRMNKVTFRVFFPFITFNNIYNIDVSTLNNPRYIAFLAISVLLTAFLLFLSVPFFVKENTKRGVVIQALFRGNYVLFGLQLALSVCGEESGAIAAMSIAIVVPMFNVISTIVLEYFNDKGGNKSAKSMLVEILKNPLIQGSLLGLVFCVFHIGLPDYLATPVNAVSNMVTPLAIFILGGGFAFKEVFEDAKALFVIVSLRLIVIPLLALIPMVMLGFRGAYLFCGFCVYSTPVAAASYAMAENMGGDKRLARNIIVATTVISVFTIFAWIVVLNEWGLL